MGVFPFMILCYLNVCILKKLMVRRTWATKSMKKNNETRRYLNRRFVKEHKCGRLNECDEEFDLKLIKSCNLTSSNRGSLDQGYQQTDKSNENNDALENHETETINSMMKRKKKISIDPESLKEKRRPSCLKQFHGERKTSTIVSIENDEDHVSLRQCQPRIHTSQETNRGKNVVELAWITLAIVFVFMICHSIKWIANFYEMIMVSICIMNDAID